jgi:DNA-binding IclR family transcriptional regulator
MLLASGRCLLVDVPREHLADLVGASEEFLARFAAIAADGYEISRGDRWSDVNAVAAPVRDQSGRTVAAIAVSAAASRFQDPQLELAALAVRETARSVSRDLGAPASMTAPES